MNKLFESIFHSVLVNEDGDDVDLPDGTNLLFSDSDANPFIMRLDGKGFVTGEYPTSDTHFALAQDCKSKSRGWRVNNIHIEGLSPKDLQALIAAADNENFMMIHDNFLTGRVWAARKVMAFWNSPRQMASVIEKIVQFYGAQPDWILDFKATDLNYQPTLEQYRTDIKNGKFGNTSRPKEDTEALIRQHLEPQFKKKLGAQPGSAQNAKVAASAGYNTPAKFNAARIIGDSVQE